jgi:hypothetical protein
VRQRFGDLKKAFLIRSKLVKGPACTKVSRVKHNVLANRVLRGVRPILVRVCFIPSLGLL